MNADLLLRHFDRLADAPDAIPRLRQFILDLAVRGKLVPQDPNDEPASELLKRIQTERMRSEPKGKAKESDLEEYPVADMPFAIPDSWVWTRLGHIGSWGSGTTPPRGSHEYYGGDITWLKSGELNDNPQLKGSQETVTELATQRLSFRINQPGDVLIAMYGATIGKVAILAEPAVTNQAVCGCSPYCVVFNRYLFTFLLAQRSWFHEMSEGGAQPNISKAKIVGFAFPLPPLAEQHRIVAKVDELMTLCDQLEAAQAEREAQRDKLVAASLGRLNQPTDDAEAFREHACFTFAHLPRLTARAEHIKHLRQTILNLAVRGKLVPQDPNDEPASDLFERLSSRVADFNRQDGIRRRNEIESAAGDLGGKTFPSTWMVSNFDSLNLIVSGVAKGKDLRGQKTVAYPYLRVANVQRGHLDLSLIKEIDIRIEEFDRYRLQGGDVLMTEGGDWDKLGRAAIWNEEIPNCIHQNHIYRIRSANKYELLPQWIALFANSYLGRSYFEDASKQTTNLASINMTQLRSCPLPLPPTKEQHRIVAKVDELMALCGQLDAQVDATHADSQRLLEAVLHGALAG